MKVRGTEKVLRAAAWLLVLALVGSVFLLGGCTGNRLDRKVDALGESLAVEPGLPAGASVIVYRFVEADSGRRGGLGEMIAKRLAENPALKRKFKVLTPPAAEAPEDPESVALPGVKGLAAAGRLAGADLVLAGSIAPSAKGATVRVELAHSRSAKIWTSASFELEAGDLPAPSLLEQLEYQKKSFEETVASQWLPNLAEKSVSAPRTAADRALRVEKELIYGEDFEVPGSDLPLLWSVNPALVGNGNWRIDPPAVTGATKALRLAVVPNQAEAASHRLFFEVVRPLDVRRLRGKRIELQAWIRTGDLRAGGAYIGVYFDRRRSLTLADEQPDSYGDRLVHIEYEVPEDVSSALLYCLIKGHQGQAWFDEITLKEIRFVEPEKKPEDAPETPSGGKRFDAGEKQE